MRVFVRSSQRVLMCGSVCVWSKGSADVLGSSGAYGSLDRRDDR